MKILFATDGSTASLDALQALLAHYDWFRDPPALTLLHVHPPIPYGMAARWVGKHTVDEHYAEESRTALAPGRQLLDQRGIVYTAQTRVGDPAQEIVTAAREGGFDCIALGTRGHAGIASLMLGSVAHKVLAAATLPVLLLK
jgi:nucleotide-binding universal stress UspA family protein